MVTLFPMDPSHFNFPCLGLVVSIFVLISSFVLFKFLNKGKTPCWRQFSLKSTYAISHDTNIYEFQVVDGSKVNTLKPGQHMAIRATIDGRMVQRNYTPLTVDCSRGIIKCLIKTYHTGILSKHLHNLGVGNFIEISEPKGRYVYVPNSYKEIGMIAGGSGLTPMLQIINFVLENPQDTTIIKLIFANRTTNDLLLFNRLEWLQEQHKGRFSLHWVIEVSDPTIKISNSSFGFVTSALIGDFLPKPCDASKLLICGPAPMVSHVLKESLNAGWPALSPISKPHEPIFVF